MVAVVEVEVKSQRQGILSPFHRLAFESEGCKFLSQGIKFGLIVGSFQDKCVFMPQNYKLWLDYRAKSLILRCGFRRKVYHTQ